MGLYSIITRADGTVLTGFNSVSDIFNVDHENHVIHTAAEFLNSWEEDVAQMNQTTNPLTSGGLVSLPTVLKDENERLRYQIARIKQQISGAATAPKWYDATGSFTDGVQLAPTAGRLELSLAQGIPTGVFTKVNFDVTQYAVGGVRVVLSTLVAPVDGVYICGGTLGFTDPSGMFEILLRQTHGTTNSDIAANASYAASNFQQSLTAETVKHFAANDRLSLLVVQQSGSAKDPIHTLAERPALWMSLVGRG